MNVAELRHKIQMPALPRVLKFVASRPTVPSSVELPQKAPTTGIDFPTAWARRMPARAIRRVVSETLMQSVVTVVLRPTVIGLERLATLSEEEPVIFVANHSSHADTPLLLRSLPEPWRNKLFVAAAADYFFPNRGTGIASALLLNAVPIERNKVTRRSALAGADLIDEGWSMLIYPEGGRSPDGWAQPFRGGAAFLSNRTHAPVVPIHVSGTAEVMPKGKNWPKPGPTTVTFGEPIRTEGLDSKQLSRLIERSVETLADERQTDWYQARRRFHAGTTPSLGGPDSSGWRKAWALGTAQDEERRRGGSKAWPPR